MRCAVLQVSRRGYYASVQRRAALQRARDELTWQARVRAIHAQTGQSYGSRRLAKPRQNEGSAIGRFRARRLMKQAGVALKLAKHSTGTTDSRQAHPVAPNLVARPLAVEQPNHVWAGAMTYLWTAAGWV